MEKTEITEIIGKIIDQTEKRKKGLSRHAMGYKQREYDYWNGYCSALYHVWHEIEEKD